MSSIFLVTFKNDGTPRQIFAKKRDAVNFCKRNEDAEWLYPHNDRHSNSCFTNICSELATTNNSWWHLLGFFFYDSIKSRLRSNT